MRANIGIASIWKTESNINMIALNLFVIYFFSCNFGHLEDLHSEHAESEPVFVNL